MILPNTTVAPNDASWLFSTVAQSAAALVAIIGGLLAARLVTLASEREGLHRQRDQLRGEAEIVRAELEPLQAAALAFARRRWRRRVAEQFLRERRIPESLPIPKIASADDVTDWSHELWREIEGLFPRIEEHQRRSPRDRWSIEALRESGFDTRAADLELVDEILDELERERRAAAPRSRYAELTGGLAGINPRSLLPAGTDYERQEQDRRVDKIAELEAEVRALSARADLADRQALLVSAPQSAKLGLWALAAFSVLGILFPIVLLACRPVPSGPWIRTIVVLAFLAGLSMVVGYIAWQWSTLRPNGRAD